MGLLGDLFKNRKLDDPVPGTLQITSASGAPHDATSGNVRLMGVVQGEGVPPTSVEHHCIARVEKWPRPGATLPVVVDRADPTSFKIQWDEIQDGWSMGRDQAQALADALRGGATTSTGAAPQEVLDMLAARGITLPPGAQVSVVSSSADVTAFPGDEDPAARLRRLDGLKASGLVTDAEYAEQRARILADL